jgi:hypothetical protein
MVSSVSNTARPFSAAPISTVELEMTMFSRQNCVSVFLCLSLTLASCLSSAQAGVIRAVKDKHKANPNTLHAKVKENIKDHKAYSGHQPIRHSKRK